MAPATEKPLSPGADLDGDRKPEIVVANAGSDGVSVLMNLSQ